MSDVTSITLGFLRALDEADQPVPFPYLDTSDPATLRVGVAKLTPQSVTIPVRHLDITWDGPALRFRDQNDVVVEIDKAALPQLREALSRVSLDIKTHGAAASRRKNDRRTEDGRR